MDPSNGYESVAAEFLVRRGNPATAARAIGVNAVRDWARTLPQGAAILDLGCGPGYPITAVLIAEKLNVYAVDAAPSFVQAFRRNFPDTPIICDPVEDSTFFDRAFDAVLAWGLIFLLSPETQRRLFQKIANALAPGGRLLFTSCTSEEPQVWTDAMTGLESRSLGAEEYRRLLLASGLEVDSQRLDEGGNRYFEAWKINSQKT